MNAVGGSYRAGTNALLRTFGTHIEYYYIYFKASIMPILEESVDMFVAYIRISVVWYN